MKDILVATIGYQPGALTPRESSLEGFSVPFVPDPLGRLAMGAMSRENANENSGVGEWDKTSGTEDI